MRLAVLGSGSGGNATLLECDGRYLLVDAGLSAKQITLRLKLLGIEPSQLEGILLTHEHGDHVKGLEVFLRKNPMPVYATDLTREALSRKDKGWSWRLFRAGQSFDVAGVSVESFSIPHDAVDPVGFLFAGNQAQAAVLTDLGHATPRVREIVRGVKAMVLESNYCDRMLEDDLTRPWSLKQRISSRHGHLSNAQACALATELIEHGLERVILGHLSRDCNKPEVAEKAFTNLPLRQVVVASQDQPTAWVRVAEPPVEVDELGQMLFAGLSLAG
ncbi:MAG: MBL fold metallo-hydrolase [Verrucomicrobiota bacterium JB023]|nr:MBL fold metallo-hydrolase [Verrucomicrobiota bacterium JB023]